MDSKPTAYQRKSNEWLRALINDNGVYALFHYTSPEGFQGIMDSHKLRFKDRLYMNDKSEGYYTLELLRDNYSNIFPCEFQDEETKQSLFERIESFIRNFKDNEPFKVYAACFSLNGDSLPMWNYYTKDRHNEGCNLRFNNIELSNSIIKIMWPDKELHPYIFGHKVIYSLEEQIKVLKTFLTEIYIAIKEDTSIKNDFGELIAKKTFMNRFESILGRILFIGAIFKDSFFSFEEEYRIFIYPYEIDDTLYMFEKDDVSREIVESKGLAMPQIDMPFNISIIEQVMFSPTISKESEEKIVRRIKDEKNMHSVKIERSIIPVRF